MSYYKELIESDWLGRVSSDYSASRTGKSTGWEKSLKNGDALSTVVFKMDIAKNYSESFSNVQQIKSLCNTFVGRLVPTKEKPQITFSNDFNSYQQWNIICVTLEPFTRNDVFQTLNHSLDATIGYCIHETAHYLYTTTKADTYLKLLSKKEYNVKKSLHNIIEDERIETNIAKVFGGYVGYIERAKNYAFDVKYRENLNKIDLSQSEDIVQLFNTFLYLVRYPKAMDEQVTNKFEKELRQIQKILTPYPETEEEVFKAVDEVYKVFEKFYEYGDDEDEEEENGNGQGQGQGQGQGKSKQSKNQESDEQQDGNSSTESDDQDGNNSSKNNSKTKKGGKSRNSNKSEEGEEEENGSDAGGDESTEEPKRKGKNPSNGGEESDNGDETEDGDESEKSEGYSNSESENEGSNDEEESEYDSDEQDDTDKDSDGDGGNGGGKGANNKKDSSKSLEDALSDIIEAIEATEVVATEEQSTEALKAITSHRSSIPNILNAINNMSSDELERRSTSTHKFPKTGELNPGKIPVIYETMKIDANTIGNYEEALINVSGSSASLRAKIQQLNRTHNVVYSGLEEGDFDDTLLVDALMGSKKVFSEEHKVMNPGTCIGLLIDESGSMYSDYLYRKAREIAVLFERALDGVKNVDFYCYGHTTSNDISEATKINVYYEGRKVSDRRILGNIHHDNTNRDGHAILEVVGRMRQKVDIKTPIIMFMISDGQPSANVPKPYSGVTYTKAAVDYVEKNMNTQIIHIAIKPGIPSEKMFNTHLQFTNPAKLVQDIGGLLKTIMLKQQRAVVL